jgi:hypothetical protein
MLLGGIMIIGPGNENARATSATYYSDATLDGHIDSRSNGGMGETYDDALDGTGTRTFAAVSSSAYIYVGQRLAATDYEIWRGYLSFNTSALPDNVTVSAASLSVKLYVEYTSGGDFSLNVYGSNYSHPLSTAAWHSVTSYEGAILSTATASTGSWYSLSCDTTHINKTGYSEYKLTSSLEGTAPTGSEYLYIYSGDSAGNEPYLSITYSNTTTGVAYSGANQTINIPASYTQPHNNTHEIKEYKINSMDSDWVNVTAADDADYFMIYPIANVTEYGNTANVTGLGFLNMRNTTFSLWFYVPLDFVCTFHVAMWSPNGYSDMPMLGYFWESWKVYYSVGSTFNVSNCTQLASPDVSLTGGITYSFGVLDHFGNELANQTAIANVAERFINIVVPAYELAFNSLSTYDAKIRIYTTSNLSATPIDFQLPAGWARFRYLRGTDYTVRVDFIGAGVTSFFNRTVNESQTLRLNGTTIEELDETIDGVFTWLKINTYSEIAGLEITRTNEPFKPDGTRAGVTEDMGIYLDPYQLMWGTVDISQTDLTAGAKTLWGGHIDTSLMAGTVTILEDTLFISGTNTSASLMVNNSAGTTIINTTAPGAVTYNLIANYNAYKGANLTIYSNASGLHAHRIIRFRWVGRFTWVYDPTTERLTTSRAINNTLDYTIWRPMVTIAFYPGLNISQGSVTIYDADNGIYLDPTINYNVDETGISFEFDNITAGEVRTFSIVCYLAEGVDWQQEQYGTPTIPMSGPEWTASSFTEWKDRYMVSGSWMNTYPAPYTGDIVLILNVGTIDPASVIVTETNTKVLAPEDYYISGNTIVINRHPTIEPSESVSYTVYYLTATDNSIEAWLGPSLLGLPLIVWLIILGLIILAIGTISERMDGESDKTNVLQTLGAVIVIIALSIAVILAVIGVSQSSASEAAAALSGVISSG